MFKLTRFGALLTTCAIVPAAFASAAFAQTASAPAAPAQNQAASVGQIEEVIVTAERREEKLQEVPVAVSVVSSEQLKTTNYSGLTNLQFLVPSVQYNAYTGGGFQIRGVGTQSVNLSTEQDVGIVIDDVVQGIPETNFAAPSYESLTDIDRVEVLKGPQGTLFGKNSSVGVIQILTKKPMLGVFEADGSVSAADGGEYKVQGNINFPIGDDAALRMSGWGFHHAGYIDNVAKGEAISGYDQFGFRGKLLWNPTEDLSIYLIAERSHTGDTGNGSLTLRSCGSGFFTYSPCATDAPLGITASPTNNKVADEGYTDANTDTTSGSLHVDYELGDDTLTSVTAYIQKQEKEGVDVDSTPRPILSVDQTEVGDHQFTEELRLASPSNQFIEYQVGAFYYNVGSLEKNVLAGTFAFEPDNSVNLLSNGFASPVTGGQTIIRSSTQSVAVFGQATVHVTDQLSLIGGLRYTHDDVRAGVHIGPYPNICEFNYAFGAPCHTTTLPSPVVATTARASNLSGKGTIKYDFNDDVNAYFTYATGYKGPGVSYPAGLPQFVIKPETSQDFEIGVKSQWFDRRLVLNADVFDEKYTNFQGQTYIYDAANPGASNFVTANAGGLESKGVEADASYAATDDLTLTGNFAFTPTKYTAFAIQCQDAYTNPATIPGQCTYIPPGSPAGTPAQFNAAGYPLPQAPRYSYNIGANYYHVFADSYSFNANVNWSWHSSTYTIVANPNTVQGGFGLLGLNLGYGPDQGVWRISAFARNLLDQHFVSAIFPTYLDNGGATGIALPTQGYANVPNIESRRTVGVRLDFKIGG
jgi:iron complex outermembrane receptor protein